MRSLHLMFLVKYVFVPVVILLICYALYLVWEAWTEVKGAPREDMYLCNRHGFIAKQHLITFAEPMDIGTGKFDRFGKEITERKRVEYCPLCFHANMKAAESAQK